MKKSIFSIALALAAISGANAQQIPLYSNYFFTPFIYNPAQSGSSGVTEASVIHRRQWSGIEGAPQTSALTLNGALNREKIGYSLYAFSDQTDIVQRMGVYGAYAYHVRLAENSTLSFGLAAGYLNNNINQDKIRIKDESDPLLYPNLRSGNFDLNFGVNFKIANFQIGAAIPQLLGAPISYSENYSGPVEYSLIRHFVFNTQYDFEIDGDKMVLSPLVMVRTAQYVPTQVDAGAIFNMKDYGYIGAMYRSDYAITANVGVHLNDELSLGYSYDFSLNTYASALGSTNEFILTYRFGSNKKNERLENEIKRLKDQQRKQADQNEEYINEKLEEFKAEIQRQQQAELEKQKAELANGMTLYDPNKPGNTNKNAGNAQQNNQNNNAQNQQAGGNNNANTGGGNEIDNTGGTSGKGIKGYSRESYASNVTPGSPGYYVTAGVFGSESNARKLQNSLKQSGLDANVFKDKVNGMYYVYLMKFGEYSQAEGARNTGFNGQYSGKLWIKVVE